MAAVDDLPEGKVGRLHVQPMRKGRRVVGHSFTFWCPGCEEAHSFRVAPADGDGSRFSWVFGGDFDRPTFSPSMLVRASGFVKCKLWLQDGYLTFARESRHQLAGQCVLLPNLP